MPWFTFHRPSPEALAVADGIRANYQTFLQRPEWPRASAAAFLRYDHPTAETHFYFSPHSRRLNRSWSSSTSPAFAHHPSAKSDSHCWSDSSVLWSFSRTAKADGNTLSVMS